MEAAEILIEYGADPGSVDEEYRTTPLGWVVVFGNLEFARMLLDRYPDSANHAPSYISDSAHPLAWARKRGNDAVAQLVGERF